MEIVGDSSAPRTLSHYLVNEQFTDAVIFFNGIEQKVHKIVLAQGSDYFSRIFLSTYMEARSGEIALFGDSSEAIHNLIGHLYGCEVVITGIRCSEDGFHVVRNQVETYVAAAKYMVPTLCARIEETFPDNLARLLDLNGLGPQLTYIDKIARLVYTEHEFAAQKLQGPIVNLLAEHAAELTENTEFKALNAEIPELAFQLLIALAKPKKVVSLKVKKRKW